MYGMASLGEDLVARPARKRTGFLTSSFAIADELNVQCSNDHVHQRIISGRRSRAAQVYPEPLCEAVARGLTRQLLAKESQLEPSKKVNIHQLSSIVDYKLNEGRRKEHWKDTVHEEDGGADTYGSKPQNGTAILKESLASLTYSGGRLTAWDDVSGAPLDYKQVAEARKLEIQ